MTISILVLVVLGVAGLAGLLIYTFAPRQLQTVLGKFGNKPILEIGYVNYGWGGSLETVCPDGRIYSSPTRGDNSEPKTTSLAAVLDKASVKALDEALGDTTFDYSESFDDPGAVDDEYTAMARREGSGPRIDFDKQEYDHFSRIVSDLIQAYPARIGFGQVNIRRSHLRPVIEWSDKAALDLSKYRDMPGRSQDADILKYFPDTDFRFVFKAADLTAGELAAYKKMRESNSGDFAFDSTGSAFFFQDGDPSVLYQITVTPNYKTGEIDSVDIRVKQKVRPLKDLAAVLGESEDGLRDLLGQWKQFDYKKFKLNGDPVTTLDPLTTHGSDQHVGTEWVRDGRTWFAQFEYDVEASPGVEIAAVKDPCGLPWPKDLIVGKGNGAAVEISASESYSAKSASAVKEAAERAEAASRPEGVRSAGFGEWFDLDFAGDAVAIKDGGVTVRAVEVGTYCDEQPGAIDYEFVTSAPGSCQDVNRKPRIDKVVATIDGAEHEIAVDSEKGYSSGITVSGKSGLIRVIVMGYTTRVRVLELGQECAAGKTADERRYCWNSAAQDLNSPELCEKIDAATEYSTIQELVDGCKRTVAHRNDSSQDCRSIADPKVKDDCLEVFALTDPKICGEVSAPRAFCLCHRIADETERDYCLERTITSFDMTASSPTKYCGQIGWKRGACAVSDILMGYPICLAWGDGKCVQPVEATGIWNCADIKDAQAEKDCYRGFIDQNKMYAARPQGVALCDSIRDEARKARCQRIMTAEGLVKVP